MKPRTVGSWNGAYFCLKLSLVWGANLARSWQLIAGPAVYTYTAGGGKNKSGVFVELRMYVSCIVYWTFGDHFLSAHT